MRNALLRSVPRRDRAAHAVAAAALLLSTIAAADQSVPGSGRLPQPNCEGPPARVTAEIARLLESAARHATRSSVCVDGHGEVTTIKLLQTCIVHSSGAPNKDVAVLKVWTRYHVIVAEERGGECSPYPECAKSPPPAERTLIVDIAFSSSPRGLQLIVPTDLPGVPLKTSLARKHSTDCYGEVPAFVPRVLGP